MDPTLLRSYLCLLQSPSLTVTGFSRLLRQYGRLGALLQSTEHGEALANALAKIPAAASRRIDATLCWLQASADHHLLTFEDTAYPPLLRQIDSAPPLILVAGTPALLQHPGIAIVGSRRATAYGEQQARWLGKALSLAGLVVNSGLARGIDSAAHQGALLGRGLTVAVLGTGPDQVYPKQNWALADRVREKGALVSEFLPGTPPLRSNFPRRNRIISGLSLGTVVVEASRRSGSLISARLAMEQNREVFAVPGPVTAPASRGCHWLIKSGAKLVETVEDVLEEFSLDALPREVLPPQETDLPDSLPADARKLLEIMAGHGWGLDVLVEKTGCEPGRLCSLLSNLEIAGLVKAENGRYIPLHGVDLPSQKG